MSLFGRNEKAPLWRDEFSIRTADEGYVTRRQFAKFLALASLGMFVGNLWILLRAWLAKRPTYLAVRVATLGEIPIGGVKLFAYPTSQEQCILVRLGEHAYVAYSQKCTHLSCAVYYAPQHQRLECPCHEGYFSVQDGSVLQGPPPRPLPRVLLEKRGNGLFATGIDIQSRS